VAGVDDRFVGAGRHSGRLHWAVSHSELVLVPGAGHMVHQIALEEVLGAIDRAHAAT
jgi:pimeloyl-ACP methyl ester carboxylesterase